MLLRSHHIHIYWFMELSSYLYFHSACHLRDRALQRVAVREKKVARPRLHRPPRSGHQPAAAIRCFLVARCKISEPFARAETFCWGGILVGKLLVYKKCPIKSPETATKIGQNCLKLHEITKVKKIAKIAARNLTQFHPISFNFTQFCSKHF